jgi:hypothetical protein
MAQVFSRRSVLVVRLVVLGGALLAAGLVAWAVAYERAYDSTGLPVEQPIPFSHKHHVGDDGLDCRHCHTTVETSAHAGMPSTHVCLGCHSQLFADAPVLQPLRESAATGRPIAWRRVHFLPGFVFFNHSVHVARGVPCVECHGRIDQMPLAWRAQRLEMQWCFDCHRDPAGRRVARDQVFSMTPVHGGDLPPLEPERRRTDCSTCHR